MTDVPTRDEIIAYARLAGLNLPDAYLDDLVGAYTNIRTLLAAMPIARPRGDEPAHVFNAREFLPADAPAAKG
jgi:hypothetical protein